MMRLWLLAIGISAAAHGAFASWVQQREPRKHHPKPPPIEMELSEPEPKPEPEPEPVPEPPPPPKPVLVKKIATKPIEPPPPAAPEPPPPEEAPKVGIAEDATAPGGDMAVATGVTLDGEVGTGTKMEKPKDPPPPQPAGQPGGRPGGTGKKFVPIYEVTRLPKAKQAVQPDVPEAFRAAQREALVVVEVEIDARGRVMGARVLRGAGFGLEEAALDAAKRTEFEPALVGTKPVAVRFQIPYRFRVRG